jgi:ADP-heptose:LPS heptosyltransferase
MSAGLRALRLIEESGHRALFTPLLWLSGRARRPDPRLLRGRPLRVLFIVEDAIGDTLLAAPAMRAIADSHPGTVVDVVTWEGPATALRHATYIRHLIVFTRGDRRRLNAWAVVRRHGPYDVVVDGMVFHGHVRSRSFAMMIGSGARYWVGERARGNDWLLNIRRPPFDTTAPHLRRMLELVEPLIDVVPAARPVLPVTEAELSAAKERWGGEPGSPRVVVNVSTSGPERKWPMERFTAVARHLRARAPGARIIVVGLDRDRRAMDAAAAAGSGSAMSLNLRELMATIACSDVVISPDTAVCHIASAFVRPLVSIHVPGQSQFLPYDTPGVRVLGSSPETMEGISVAVVLEAVDAVFESLGSPTAHAGARQW